MTAPRLALPGVTLLAVDTRSPALALAALAHCTQQVGFARSLLLTHRCAGAPPLVLPEGVQCEFIAPIGSAADYSRFVLGGLLPWVQTPHVLVVQWDGFVLDASAWDDAFLETDYLGAPWGQARDDHRVGNGGFSLRSRRLLQALQDPAVQTRWHHPEDICIAQTLRRDLEDRFALRFGSVELAQRFAFENEPAASPTFGFHGAMHLHRVLGHEAFESLLAQLPDDVVRGRDGFKMARALLRDGLAASAHTLLRRRLALGARDLRTRWLHTRARLTTTKA